MKPVFLFLVATCLASTTPAQTALQLLWATNAHSEHVRSVAFSGDSRRLASASPDGYAKVWDLATNAPVQSLYTFNATMLSVALSSNGQLVGAGGGDGASRMWRVSDGLRLMPGFPDDDDIVWSVAFSPCDSYFAIGHAVALDVWHVPSRSYAWFKELEFEDEDTEVYSLGFSPDGRWLASGGSDSQVMLWDALSGGILRVIGQSAPVTSVEFSPDSSRLLTGCRDDIARLWNVTNGASLLVITNTGVIAKFLGDGRYLMTLDDPNSFSYRFQIFRTSDGHYMGGYTNTAATCFAVARDGRYFAYGTTTGSVVLAYAPLIHEGFTREKRRTFMHWWGGSGYYQVQRRSKERGHKWRNWGQPTTNTTTRITDRPHFAYRVLSLPPP